MANKTLRIEIPKNIDDQLTLAEDIYKKHMADGASSVLKVMKDFNWDAAGPNIANARASHNEAKEMERQLEKIYEKRNKQLVLAGMPDGLTSTRDFLKGVYSKSPKMLGDHGFKVDDTPKAKKITPDKQ